MGKLGAFRPPVSVGGHLLTAETLMPEDVASTVTVGSDTRIPAATPQGGGSVPVAAAPQVGGTGRVFALKNAWPPAGSSADPAPDKPMIAPKPLSTRVSSKDCPSVSSGRTNPFDVTNPFDASF